MRTLFGRALAAALVVALGLAAVRPASARSEEETVRAAEEVLQQFLDLRMRQIPESMLADAHGVAIIPNLIKLGFVVGGQRGRGVVIVREADGTWRAPMFVTLTGGSIGWQAGAQSSDIVLVFKTQKSVEGLLRGKFTLGADASVAAGPVGRRAAAATDTELKAEIYSYSRSRGLFAGVSIDGSAIQVDDAANLAYYGGGAGHPVPESALRLVQAIANLTAQPEVVVGPQAGTALPGEGVPTPANPEGVPLQATPLQGTPLNTLPGNMLPGNTLPGNAVPGNAVPGNTLPGNTLPGNTLPGGALPGSGLPGGRFAASDGQPMGRSADEQPSLSLAGPQSEATGPAIGGSVPSGGPAAPAAGAPNAALQAELARAAASLTPLLDDSWRRYLALPAEVYQPGRQPSAAALRQTVGRYESVLRDPQYRALAERQEFQRVHGLLRAYSESQSASGAPQIALPPPPGAQR